MAADNFLLLEDGDFLLLEDGYYIILDEYAYVVSTVAADNTDIHGNVYDDVVDVTLENVSNVGGNVTIDVASGIVVSYPGAPGSNNDSILDGASGHYQIVASGTVSHEQAASSWGQTYVEIVGSGLPVQTPAFLAWMAEGLAPGSSDQRTLSHWLKRRFIPGTIGYVASSSGGAVVSDMWAPKLYQYTTATVHGGYPAISVIVENGSPDTAFQAYARYHILKEPGT